MNTCLRWAIASLTLTGVIFSSSILAYGGGGGGGSSCNEAKFFRSTPPADATVTALTDFSVVASDNTEISTLDVQINGSKIQPVVTPQRSGDFLIEAKPAAPVTATGKVRITLRAKSKEGCETFKPIYIEVKP